jgi:hypothetical protein
VWRCQVGSAEGADGHRLLGQPGGIISGGAFCTGTGTPTGALEGPVTRVIHSADGHWLACEVAPEGGTRTQIWVVTTDPDDRMARRIDNEDAGTAELIGWWSPKPAAG